jgi:hypothetical protein
MKKSVADKWVEALLSGKFKQTTGSLKKTKGKSSGHCCLGVLCAISNLGKWNRQGNTEERTFLGASEFLPREVEEWAGMTSDNGNCSISIEQDDDDFVTYDNLVEMNDDGRTFKEIAEVIKKNYKKL